MNKNYRSIWNDALGAWVAVSEIETAKGKPAGSSVKAAGGIAARAKLVLRVIPLMLGVVFGLGGQVAYAADSTVTVPETVTKAPIIISTITTSSDITAGTATLSSALRLSTLAMNNNPANPRQAGSTVSNVWSPDGEGAAGLVIGHAATATNRGGTAVGSAAAATAYGSSAFGIWAKATGDYSMALGPGALASGYAAFAVQRQAAATANQTIAMGSVSVQPQQVLLQWGNRLPPPANSQLQLVRQITQHTLTHDILL